MGVSQRGCVLVAAACVVAGLAGEASAQVERRIGVVVSLGVNLEADEARALSTAVGEALRAELPVDVVAGEEAERRMPPEGVPEECVADSGCRNTIGRRLDADELLMLVIVKLGAEIQIDATWADVASGRVTSRPRITLAADADRAAVLREAAPRLLPHHVPKKVEPKGDNTRIVVVPGGTTQVDDGRHMTLPAWIATGVGGAALAGGMVFALSARQKYSALEDDGCRDQPDEPCSPGRVDTLERHALAADILLGVAAGSAVTALVFYLRSGGSREVAPASSPAPIAIEATPTSVGLTLGGRF